MNWSQENYISALRFAAICHGNQKVPDTDISYLFHINLVTMEIIAALPHEEGLDEDLAIRCAILHDVIEDTDAGYDEIRNLFGEQTAHGVLALSKDRSVGKEKRLTHSLKRIKNESREIWMVKMADRISNLQKPPVSWNREKISGYFDDSIIIHENLKEGSRYLSARLSLKINEYRRYLE
jgi:(p)ppGpp synthase/HD superfamily hydrolase